MENSYSIPIQLNSKQVRINVNLANLLVDPCLRKKIHNCHPNDKNQI
jgi:hypothetical protein